MWKNRKEKRRRSVVINKRNGRLWWVKEDRVGCVLLLYHLVVMTGSE